jgi:glycosyltransferase involved in cell wall biosynthesis
MLAPEFLPVWGGVGTYIIGLVKHLPKNIEIHVVTPNREEDNKRKTSTLDYNFSKYFGSNVQVHLVSKADDTFFYNARFQHACFNYVPKLIKEEGIDIIHSHTAHMPDLQLMFRKLGVPTITTVHTTIRSQRLGTKNSLKGISQFERTEKATYLMYPALRLAEEVYFAKKRAYVSPSYWMKKWLEHTAHTNGNVKVIPNSIDIKDYKTQNTQKESIPDEFNRKIILYVGRLLAMKGIDTLIESVPKVLKNANKDDNVLFLFAGPGDVGPYMEKVTKLGIERHCLFLGPLSRESTIQLMGAAELVVVPSYLENCPYVVLESMACGTPVVASKVGGIPEIIDDNSNGVLVEPGSTEALAKAILGILTDKALRNSMSERAREKIAKNFSWDVNVEKYVAAYSEAMN